MSIANSLKTTGNLNIMIHRDITSPPKDASGKPARQFVWQRTLPTGYTGSTLLPGIIPHYTITTELSNLP